MECHVNFLQKRQKSQSAINQYVELEMTQKHSITVVFHFVFMYLKTTQRVNVERLSLSIFCDQQHMFFLCVLKLPTS